MQWKLSIQNITEIFYSKKSFFTLNSGGNRNFDHFKFSRQVLNYCEWGFLFLKER